MQLAPINNRTPVYPETAKMVVKKKTIIGGDLHVENNARGDFGNLIAAGSLREFCRLLPFIFI